LVVGRDLAVMQNQKIFLVEDDEKIVKLLIATFKQWNFDSVAVGVQNFRKVTSEILKDSILFQFFKKFQLKYLWLKRHISPLVESIDDSH
jgi:hypothetical protein